MKSVSVIVFGCPVSISDALIISGNGRPVPHRPADCIESREYSVAIHIVRAADMTSVLQQSTRRMPQ